jgi:hypothetical protein
MRNREHPAYQRAERKLRRFAGILDNFPELLREDWFDLDEAERRWYGEYEKLRALEEAAGEDPARLEAWHAEEQRVEAELFQRMDRLIKFIYAHAPDHPWLPPYRLYMGLWHQCYGEPIRQLSEEDLEISDEADELLIGICFRAPARTQRCAGDVVVVPGALNAVIVLVSARLLALNAP